MADLEKEFVVPYKNFVGENYTICRIDYESMPIPMKADAFTDAQMAMLAETIANELQQYVFDKECPYYEDELDDAFWKEMETCAVKAGMAYYEDDNV